MSSLSEALEPYRHLDPPGWVGLYEQLSVPAAVSAVSIGALLLFLGGGRLFRVLAGPLGALAAVLWAAVLTQRFGFSAYEREATIGAAVVLAGLGLMFPPVAIAFAVGVPSGLAVAGLVPPRDWLLGFAPGFIVGAALGALFQGALRAIVASVVGAWVLMLGLLRLAAAVVSVDAVAKEPVGCLAAAAVLAVGGMTYQLYIRLSPEVRAERKRARAVKKKMDSEQKAAEKRWADYRERGRRS